MSAGRRYRVLGILGRGGFGTVYKAEQLGDGAFVRPVALKVLNADVVGLSSVAARLRDEARMLALIRHRAILQVDGLVWLDGRWTVVMEYVAGADLARVASTTPLPARVAAEVIGEVASALHVANTWPSEDGGTLGLLHRDLKPANLLLTSAGEVKVLDFGVARARWSSREAETQGMRFGTPDYMAPERYEGDEHPAGDIYSLGAVWFELMTGSPLGRGSIRESRHRERVAEGLAVIAHLDVALRGLLAGMLAWRHEDRPTARDVETQCRQLVVRLDGPFLRDWAEEHIPGLMAAELPDAQGEFSNEIVVESGPTEPAPTGTYQWSSEDWTNEHGLLTESPAPATPAPATPAPATPAPATPAPATPAPAPPEVDSPETPPAPPVARRRARYMGTTDLAVPFVIAAVVFCLGFGLYLVMMILAGIVGVMGV